MMAAYGVKGFGWFVCCAVIAPGCYLVTSQVAAERARVATVERSIMGARRDIRDLQTEISTRSNLAQLERWNGDVLAMSAPRADQYLKPGVAGVAELDSGRFGGDTTQMASLVVPRAPVFVDGVVPQDAPVATTDAHTPAPAATETAQNDVTAKTIAAKTAAGSHAAGATHAAADNGKREALAMLDQKLLSDSTMDDLMRQARAERRSR